MEVFTTFSLMAKCAAEGALLPFAPEASDVPAVQTLRWRAARAAQGDRKETLGPTQSVEGAAPTLRVGTRMTLGRTR